MKKKSRKSVQKKSGTKTLVAGVVGILALEFGLGLPLLGAEQPAKKVPTVRHEMVPHVVLPETIQYNKVAQSLQSQPGISTASDYGMVSPFVGTYTPFPSYQMPLAAELKGVNQSVYPVSPKLLPKPLPPKTALPKELEKEPVSGEAVTESDLTMEKKDSSTDGTEAVPILLASGSEEVVQASPTAPLSNEVTQTGIFCKQAKPPAAWSFSSPIFKAASVPVGLGGQGGYGSYINQNGMRGANTTQLGVGPGGQFQPGAPVPYPTGMEQGFNNGLQTQVLPNGMILLTMPPDHGQCGLIRCRGNTPHMMLLPPAPGGFPGVPGAVPGLPQQTPPPSPSAMMMPGFPGYGAGAGMLPMQAQWSSPSPYSMPTQPQLQPIMAMTPYGVTVVGYQPAPAVNPTNNIANIANMGMYGMGMMPAQQFQALQYQQLQQLQLLQAQQMQAGLAASQTASTGTPKSDGSQNAENQDEAAGDLQAPLPINSQAIAGLPGLAANPYINPYATPYGLYAQQVGATGVNQDATLQGGTSATDQLAAQQMMFGIPPQGNFGISNPYVNPYANPYAGAYMTPYGMMTAGQPSPMGMGGMGGFGGGFMPVGFQPYGQPGFMPVSQPGMNQGGMSMSDVIQLVMLLNNNNNQRHRRGLFQRIAERRASRREQCAQNDPFNQLMQAWTTPYSAPDTAVRMPSRNAYPYGYFGVQAGPQDTANYGGYYNLYMGNTSYPGLY